MKTKSGNWVDPGRVGAVTQVNPDVVRRLVQDGFIPVIAPVAVDADGKSLNVNADTVAGKVAEALPARRFVLLTDIEGVRGSDGEVASSLSALEIDALKREGLSALAGGVHKAHIIDGRVRHAVLLEIFTDEGVGTEITR
jgi:acetylglutamate kinase